MKRLDKYCILTVLLLGVAYQGSAQEQPTSKQLADKYYAQYNYSMAAPLFRKMAKKRKVKPEVYYKLADCYDQTQQYPDALEYYQKYYSLDSVGHVAVLERMGDIYKILQRYPEAKATYAKVLEISPAYRYEVPVRMDGCDSAMVWMKDPQPYAIYNVANLNSEYSDWGATYYQDKIVFTSEDQKRDVLPRHKEKRRNRYGWTGNHYLKLYTANSHAYNVMDTVSDKSGSIQDFGFFANDSRYHVGPAAFSPDYNTVVFTVTNEGKDLQNVNMPGHRMRQRNLEMYISKKDSTGKWSDPVAFAYNSPENYSVGHAAFNKNGKILYFVSDMPGGYGKTDLWYCDQNADGSWGKPHNCGKAINTSEEEAFPSVTGNGDLVFASMGHAGLGGYDMFVTTGERDSWTQPANMLAPINSSYDDFELQTRGEDTGYFASNRPGGRGSDDIYEFNHKKRKPIILKVIVEDNNKNRLPGTDVTFKGEAAPKMAVADANGVVYFAPLMPHKMYAVKGENRNYLPDSNNFNTNASILPDTVVEYLTLNAKPVPKPEYKVGDKFVLENLYYDFDKYNIRPDAALVLDKLVDILRKYPTMEIELSSHTDSRGNDAYNMRLSQHRAESAVAYLISKGIASYRIRAKGYGETRLTNGCSNGVPCTEEEHQKNRRTEVEVLKM